MLITKGIKVKLYSNLSQREWLNQQFGNIRFIWNYFLAYIQKRYKAGKKFPRKYDLDEQLTLLKHKNTWLKESDSRSLQVECHTLWQTYKRFFKRICKHPKFKSKKYFKQSYTTSSIPKQSAQRHSLKLAKLGRIKAHSSSNITGKIKRATVTLAPTGNYYASLTVEYESQVQLPKTNRAVGIDVGLDDLAILSNGMKWNFKYYDKASEAKKHRWQILLARRRRGAVAQIRYDKHLQRQMPNHHVKPLSQYKNYQKAKREVARISRYVRNQRINYLQFLTTWLVRHYDFIAIEDLKVSNMRHNHHLARAIACASWRKFRIMLTYKCHWYGKTLITVDPKNTSRVCNYCGTYTGAKPLSIRNFYCTNSDCPYHNIKHDRDMNAAINILHLGLEQAMANNSTSIQHTRLHSCVKQALGVPKNSARSAELETRYFSTE